MPNVNQMKSKIDPSLLRGVLGECESEDLGYFKRCYEEVTHIDNTLDPLGWYLSDLESSVLCEHLLLIHSRIRALFEVTLGNVNGNTRIATHLIIAEITGLIEKETNALISNGGLSDNG